MSVILGTCKNKLIVCDNPTALSPLFLPLIPHPLFSLSSTHKTTMGTKRKHTDESEVDDPKITAALRMKLVDAMGAGFEGALALCVGAGAHTEVLLADLARFAPYADLDAVIAGIRTHVTESPPTTPQRLAAISRAVETLMARTRPDAFLRGKVGALLLYVPTADCLSTRDTPLLPSKKARTEAANDSTHTILTAADIAGDVYLSTVRDVAAQAGALPVLPHFEAAMAKTKSDVEGGGGGGNEKPASSVPLLENASVFGRSRTQTELLLVALVRTQAALGKTCEKQLDKLTSEDLQSFSDILQSTTQGLAKELGDDAAEHAVAEGMHDFVWNGWRGTPAKETDAERANSVVLGPSSRPASKGKEAHIAGFLRGATEQSGGAGGAPKKLHSCETFLAEAAYHLHPDAGMDAEYFLSRNPLYIWRAFRMMMNSRDFLLPAKCATNNASDLESAIKEGWPKLGEEEMARQMGE